MTDYSRPLLRNNPSSLIIHVGTNNLKNDGVYTVRNKLLDLKDSIEEQYPNTEVILSTLTMRTDDPILKQKVSKVNGLLLGPGLNVINNNNARNSFPRHTPGVTTKGNSTIKVTRVRTPRVVQLIKLLPRAVTCSNFPSNC